MLTEWIDALFEQVYRATGYLHFESQALTAVVLVSLICGAIGPMVVGNRMAFFSDAMAHCAFAGVTLGILSAIFLGEHDVSTNDPTVVGVMVGFGILVGV